MKQKNKAQWRRLDNAAKIFPPTSSKRDTKVFRFSCELNEAVESDALQQALYQTLDRFPFYRSALKRGLFWYYFEDRDNAPPVREEYKTPCARLYKGDKNDPLFEVTFFGNRINLEVYHALTDGTGALHFLRTLVLYYLKEKHPDELGKQYIDIDYDASESQKKADSFSKYYDKPQKRVAGRDPKAFHLHGDTLPDYRISVIEGCLSAKALLAKARELNTTISVLLCTLLIQAFREVMTLREQRYPVVITVPVNLRNYFPSSSARNFFGVIHVGYHFTERSGTQEDIFKTISKAFRNHLTEEHLSEHINRLSAIEHSFAAKIVPLPLKDPVMNLANRYVDRTITAAFSNIGRISMPEELVPYINRFDMFSSTRRLQCCACSFEDKLVITFSTPFLNTEVQRTFFRSLVTLGLSVEISGNQEEEPDTLREKSPREKKQKKDKGEKNAETKDGEKSK